MREATAPPGGIRIRPLQAERDDAALTDLRGCTFGRLTEARRASFAVESAPAMRDHRLLGAFDGPHLVAMARFHDMRQCWHGRAIPMAGVAGVGVAPEARGRGVGRRLVTELLETIAARGYPLAVLFPSTMPIYRSLGWEVAGTSYEAVFAAHALRPLAARGGAELPGGGPPAVRRAGPQDAAEVREVIGRLHTAARDCGPCVPDETVLRLALGDPQHYVYLAADGLLGYTWRSGHDELFVTAVVAGSAQTTRALWGIVASNCWIADTVRARLGPADPVWWLTPDPVAGLVDHDDWMLRVVDAAAAIAGRGFPLAAGLTLPLQITDDVRPGNSGRWRLEVGAGRGSLTPDERAAAGAPLSLGARGLAALYAGTPLATLRRAGLAEAGDTTQDALLDSAFGATPYMLDRF